MPASVLLKKPPCGGKILSHDVSVSGEGADENVLLYLKGVGSDPEKCRGSDREIG